jgi:regulator of nucleoside diphosphate kinase
MPLSTPPDGGKPPIHLSQEDYDVIADIAMRMERRAPTVAAMILDEIDRAEIHTADALPHDVVAIGSEVEFLDESSGQTRRLQLVLPDQADIEAGRLSVVTPVGAGLIGMSVAREIDWPYPDGRPRRIKILSVDQRR